MQLWQMARAMSRRRRLGWGLAIDDFWIAVVGDICRTLDSVRRHGGFEHLCGHWPGQAKRECVIALDELMAILSEWKGGLEGDLSTASLPHASRSAAHVLTLVTAGD